MKIFTCKDRLEDIMTCIYDAWSEALLIGHDQIQLKKEPVFQQTIFDEQQYANPRVMRILELRRKVSNESHHFREFARFERLNSSNVYVSHLEPKSDVIMLVGRHFADRMPSEQWMIIDDNRKTACVHPKDGENYLRYLTDEEFQTLRKTEEYEDEYTDLWKTFFHAIAIDERKNYVCQRNLFPLWKRKHAVEFKK